MNSRRTVVTAVLATLGCGPNVGGSSNIDGASSSSDSSTADPTSSDDTPTPGTTTASDQCPSPLQDCDGECRDTDVDPNNCGGCGLVCDEGLVCSTGTCATTCGPGTTECNGICVDTDHDPDNCGQCDLACEGVDVCDDGICASTCSANDIACNGGCVDPTSDADHCGAADDCSPPNDGQACVSSGLFEEACLNAQCVPYKEWSAPVSLEVPPGFQTTATDVSVNIHGDAIATWFAFDGIAPGLFVSHYSHSTNAWSTPTVVVETTSASNHHIELHASGQALLIWRAVTGEDTSDIRSSHFDPLSKTWSPAETVHQPIGPGQTLTVEADADGVWSLWRENAPESGLSALRFDFRSSTWGVIESVAGSGDAEDATMAVGSSGDAVVVWRAADDSEELRTRRFDPSNQTWGVTQFVGESSVEAAEFRVAVDGSGDAIVVWSRTEAPWFRLRSSEFLEADGYWRAARVVADYEEAQAFQLDLQLGEDGAALAVWHLNEDGESHIHAARYDGEWTEPTVLSGPNAAAPRVRLDAFGHALVLWAQRPDGIRQAWGTRFEVGAKHWDAPERLSSASLELASSTIVVDMNPNGDAVAVWNETESGESFVSAINYR